MSYSTNDSRTTFLSLPIEVRNTIYTLALTLPPPGLASPTITYARERSIHFICEKDGRPFGQTTYDRAKPLLSLEPGDSKPFKPNLAILRANSQISYEAAFVLYNYPVYSFLSDIVEDTDEAWEALDKFLRKVGTTNRMYIREIRIRMPPDEWYPASQWCHIANIESKIFRPWIRQQCCRPNPWVDTTCEYLLTMAVRSRKAARLGTGPRSRGCLETLYLAEQYKSHPNIDIWNIWEWGLNEAGLDIVYEKRDTSPKVTKWLKKCKNLRVEHSKWAEAFTSQAGEGKDISVFFTRELGMRNAWCNIGVN